MNSKQFLISAFCVLLTSYGFAQAPEKMSYQSVIRTSNGTLVSNDMVGMRVSILQGSATADSIYVETHVISTNANGLATIEIGSGDVALGSIATIDWAEGPYFLKTETDPNGGNNYTITGVSQLLSVPYALYAKKAENVEKYADGDYVMNFVYIGDLEGNNPTTIATTSATWMGNRKIMLNGYLHLEFDFPQVALNNSIEFGTADVSMNLSYNGQTIMPLDFKNIGINHNAHITIPLSALVPNSTAGTAMQFSVNGIENSSFTGAIAQPGSTVGPFPIDVRVIAVFYWLEL